MNGDLKAVQAALAAGVDVDAPGHYGQTALMLALQCKHLPIAKLLIERGADPELTDDLNSTALKHAVDADLVEGARYLIDLGVDRGHHPRDPLKRVDIAKVLPSLQPYADFWNHTPEARPFISEVESLEMLELFLAAGDDVNVAPKEIKRAWVGLATVGELRVSQAEYAANKAPRFGAANPERMDNAFWRDMIRVGCNAYTARTNYKDPDPFPFSTPIWCYDRFGSTITRLSDGRFVEVGGEHEDHYDPDFYIYNDVVIHDGHGGVEIYGYPRDVFPPTDNHSATLCPDCIYLVGCLGYYDDRQPGFTPVYQLELDSWRITPVETTGELPGWISHHRAIYDRERGTITVVGGKVHVLENGEGNLVPNEHEFVLDLETREWRRVSSSSGAE